MNVSIYNLGSPPFAPNFSYKELYSHSLDAPSIHYLNDKVVIALQAIRDYYNVPIKVNSTFRTFSNNEAVGGLVNSQHLLGNAIDFSFMTVSMTNKYNSDILSRGILFNKLRSMGVTGFGIYSNFHHIDVREPKNLSHNDSYGNYAFWNFKKKKII